MESVSATEQPRMILASGSPRRARIIGSLGIPFKRVVTDVDETLRPGADAAQEAERLARLKGETAAEGESLPVLAADTMVVMDGIVYGKPASPADAERMLGELQGRFHEVVTGVCVVNDGTTTSQVVRTQVELATMSSAEIREYVATGEPLDKAGAYHIDGRGAVYVVQVLGSPSNVAGLPVRVAFRLLGEAGVAVF